MVYETKSNKLADTDNRMAMRRRRVGGISRERESNTRRCKEARLQVVSTHQSMQVYYKVVRLKFVLFTNISPINLIKKKLILKPS